MTFYGRHEIEFAAPRFQYLSLLLQTESSMVNICKPKYDSE